MITLPRLENFNALKYNSGCTYFCCGTLSTKGQNFSIYTKETPKYNQTVLATQQPEHVKNSPILNLWAFLCRKADKVITTMVTLPDNPTTPTHLSPSMHLHYPCQPSQELILSIPMPPTTTTHPFSSTAILCDCPTTIPTTTAASNATNDDETQSQSTSMLAEENTPETTATFLHK